MPANRQRKARKLHICTVEDCGKAFKRKHDLKRHKGIHLEYHEYEYECFHCEKRFNQWANCKTHMLAMHSTIKFVCGINGCKKNSPHRSTIWKHRQKHKANDTSADVEEGGDEEEKTRSRSHPTLAPRPTFAFPQPALPTLSRPIAPLPSPASQDLQQHIHEHHALDVPFDFWSTDQQIQKAHQQTLGLPSSHFNNRRRSVLIPRPLLRGPYYTPGHVERLPRFVPTPPTPSPNVRFLFG